MSLFLNLQPLTLQKFLENGATVPVEYIQLVEGHQLYVPVTWLSDIQGAFKGKTKSCAFKLMINGFFEPHFFFMIEYQSTYQFLLILANLSERHFFFIYKPTPQVDQLLLFYLTSYSGDLLLLVLQLYNFIYF